MTMNKTIKLQRDNNRDWDDLQWIEEFYDFLQGNIPDGIHLSSHDKPKLTEKKAFSIIWYLQEHFPVFPDRIERCTDCGSLYDSWNEGRYIENKGKFQCSSCN